MQDYFKDSLVRATKTFAQTLVALIGVDAIAINQLNWVEFLLVASTSFILSLLMSVANLPVRGDSGSTVRVVEAGAPGEESAAPQQKVIEPEIF